uniref:Uncharacterized protein n=1 Tax=Arundo donax TaxID=35708 RepID=A0A0A8Y3D4_ARUDO
MDFLYADPGKPWYTSVPNLLVLCRLVL